MIKYSIVVPVYNVEKYIEKCLLSILGQTYRDFELIVVSDGSTDNSINIARDILKDVDVETQIICHENIGLGGARNTGISAASGEYIWFIDSDDYVTSNALELIDGYLSKSSSDILMFNYVYVDEEGQELNIEKGYKKTGRFSLKDEPEIIFAPNSACNKVFRAKLFLDYEIRFPEQVLYEDLHTIPKLYPYSKIESADESLYFYVQRYGSIMNSDSIKKNKEILPALNEVVRFYKERSLYENYKDQLEFLYVLHGYILSSARVIKCDKKSPLIKLFRDNLKEQFPKYKSNSYLSTLSKKERIILFCIENKQYSLLNLIFKFKSKLN